MLAAMSGGRGRDVVGDGSVEVAWTTDRSAGFRRPSPGTTVTIELSAHAPKPNRNASSASMPPSAPTEATKGEGGGGDGAAVAEEGVMPTAAAAAEGHPATASFGVAVSITAAIGEADFIAEVEKAFGFHACHPVEQAVLLMRRGEAVTVAVRAGPAGACEYSVKLVKVVAPVPLEQLGAEAHKRQAGLHKATAERYRTAGAHSWAAQRYARAVQNLLLNTLVQAGMRAEDRAELASMLTECYTGLATCHLARADGCDDREGALARALDAADRALEVDEGCADALELRRKAQGLVRAVST